MPNAEGESFPKAPSAGWLALAFVAVGLAVYAPSFEGQFLSDDLHYVRHNEYIHTPSFENLVDIWNPTSEVAELVENYAPVHLSLHSLEWQFFGPEVTGYHVVNVLLHAWAALLLALLFRRSGIAGWSSAMGAAVFLLHPANVESVAWISQLKSSSALVLSLGAILLHPKRPAFALVLSPWRFLPSLSLPRPWWWSRYSAGSGEGRTPKRARRLSSALARCGSWVGSP